MQENRSAPGTPPLEPHSAIVLSFLNLQPFGPWTAKLPWPTSPRALFQQLAHCINYNHETRVPHRHTRREGRGARAPTPKKIFNENTKKMKTAWNCENSHLPRSLRKWGWGKVSSRRLLSGKTALVGNESRFCLGGFHYDVQWCGLFSFIFVVVTNCIVLFSAEFRFL